MGAEELLERIRELEVGQAELRREVSELLVTTTERHGGARAPWQQGDDDVDSSSRTAPRPAAELWREVPKPNMQRLLPPERRGARRRQSGSSRRRQPVGRAGLSPRHHMMVLQSLGQAVHILDLQGKVLYWNRCAEHLYGYSASEAIGRNVTDLLVHADDIGPATNLVGSIFTGKCWRGKFPVKNKSGERFSIVTNGTILCMMTMVP